MAINVAGQTLVNNSSEGILNFATGSVVFDATAITAADYISIPVGFTPNYVVFINATDRIKVEWYQGMAADTCIKTAAAGTVTLETTNKGVTINTTNSFLISQNATLAVIAASKTCYWIALG